MLYFFAKTFGYLKKTLYLCNIEIKKTKSNNLKLKVMKNLTYKEAVSQLEMLERKVKLYNNLIACGIAEKNVQFYETPICESGYSMGEVLEVYCNGVLIETYNNAKEYSRSCKYQAKHGKIVLSFTKKDLKRYVELMNIRATKGYFKEYAEVRELKTKAFVKEASEVKRFYPF